MHAIDCTFASALLSFMSFLPCQPQIVSVKTAKKSGHPKPAYRYFSLFLATHLHIHFDPTSNDVLSGQIFAYVMRTLNR